MTSPPVLSLAERDRRWAAVRVLMRERELGGRPPDEFAEFVRTEIAKWGRVIKEAGIRLE